MTININLADKKGLESEDLTNPGILGKLKGLFSKKDKDSFDGGGQGESPDTKSIIRSAIPLAVAIGGLYLWEEEKSKLLATLIKTEKNLTQQQEKLKAEIDEQETRGRSSSGELVAVQTEIQKKIELGNRIINERTQVIGLVKALSVTIPDELYLTRVALNSKEMTITGKGIPSSGVSPVSDFVKKLGDENQGWGLEVKSTRDDLAHFELVGRKQ